MEKINGDIILIREENVNGCGDFADVLVHTTRAITPEDKEALSAKLAELKRKMREEDVCFDTDQMVQEACDEVFGACNWKEAGYHFLPF